MMTTVLSSRLSASARHPLVILALAGIVGGVAAFPLSYVSNTNVWIGLCLLPFACLVTGETRKNYGYLLLSLTMGGLSLLYGVKLFYFFALAFYGLWLVELMVGRCHPLMLVLVVCMSPAFLQISGILGFPIRLQLSAWTGWLLQAAGADIQVQGNVMVLEGAVFSVDDACMGLNMLAISLLMGVFILAHRFRIERKQLSFGYLALFFTTVFILNILANLFRIIVLVMFRIGPEQATHGAMGLACLVSYVVIPVYFLAGFLVRRCGKDVEPIPAARPVSPRVELLQYLFAAAMLITGITLGRELKAGTASYATVAYQGLPAENLPTGVTRIATDEFLLYVKPIPEFFVAEHSPLFCWRGSGYTFSFIQEHVVAGRTIYRGQLVKGNDILHTAWWYSNGEVVTISQLDWRMRMFRGEDKFCLINITAPDEAALLRQVENTFQNNSLLVHYEK
ncbi:exosortase N [Dawidia soli]|uniref:Exosortase N n=1 Tax=Dawidia soli TaxID=2782352 RepID=A0AAP2D708_9BACT|nr:exosortase N [Dawidia soli]MBT1685200.1 exosortase N [Dawidia soli]